MMKMFYEKVELFTEPRDIILSKMNFPSKEPEMSPFESGFLCGLLKMFRPKKILEVGLAAGGTSAIIMQCIHMLGTTTEIHSVDVSIPFYRDKSKESGYLAEIAKEFIPDVNQQRYLGHTAHYQMKKIGNEIDFLILDTTHALPGEMLDFLALLPFLSENAVVLLHDVRENWRTRIRNNYTDNEFVNNLIFSSVSAQRKFMQNAPDRKKILGGPNIAAFQISPKTLERVADYFNLLSITWGYMPREVMLNSYRQIYSEFYNEFCLWLFDVAVKLNQDIFKCQRQ